MKVGQLLSYMDVGVARRGHCRARPRRRGARTMPSSAACTVACAAAALALVHGRSLIGADRFEDFVAFEIEAWAAALAAAR